MVFNKGSEDSALSSASDIDTIDFYDMLILQLGSFTPYPLYSAGMKYNRGDVIQCHLYRKYNIPQVSYMLIPVGVQLSKLPQSIKRLLAQDRNPESEDDSDVDIEESALQAIRTDGDD